MADRTAGEGSAVRMLVDFGNQLREAGLSVGSGDVVTYCAAMAPLDPTDLLDLYWAGRATIVTGRDQIPVYNRVFKRFFLDEGELVGAEPAAAARAENELQSLLQVPEAEPRREGRDEQPAELGLVASDVRVLRTRSFASCTPDELAALRRIMARIRLTPPRRRSRRSRPSRTGRTPDLRRMVRETMRRHGEPVPLYRRRRKLRVRPLVLILDVSGSMADYSRNLLQFAHSTRRASDRVEVFCFGTDLTRITRSLERRRPDDALARAAAAVTDWEGGTRIGHSLARYVRDHARRGLGRGGIVVICSDGLDRGDPEVLARAMENLARLSHRIVWMNPHAASGGERRPGGTSLGMMVAAPHIDELFSGHDLAGLERLAARLPELN